MIDDTRTRERLDALADSHYYNRDRVIELHDLQELALAAYKLAWEEAAGPATPAAVWRAKQEQDPHGRRYDCERAELVMGTLTDDELANAAFMNYDVRPSIEDMLSGKAFAPIAYMTAVKDRIRWLSRRLSEEVLRTSLQERVKPWLDACFGPKIAADKVERNHRFLEESLELVQSLGCTASEAHQLVDYVYGRAVGEPSQEVGGVMICLAALCLASDLDMHEAAEVELLRIWGKVEAIRAKQAAKPAHSPLPAEDARAVALDWYGEQCASLARYFFAKPPKDDAMVAVVHALALDAGRRAGINPKEPE